MGFRLDDLIGQNYPVRFEGFLFFFPIAREVLIIGRTHSRLHVDEGYFPSRSEMGRPDHLRVDRGSQEQNTNTQTNPEDALFSHGFFLSLNEMSEPDCVNPVEHADISGMPDQSQSAGCDLILNDCPTELAVPIIVRAVPGIRTMPR